ncbi:nuclease-related domain-containing protein [Streptomyces longwoodensis]|uniref:nuclease-related domain-containing protein n=1 Tax=Streptomyces longwoodensis TaxID=68231 RepID=UPI00225A19AE|nr:nuclease-related domain-containing protein [Streptomyces longwoodensis]MCX5000915.1 NERD domain-containing protein [Streptomyces longwoodensis]
MTAGQSPLQWAAQERAAARRGVRRRILAWLGLNRAARRADALTARAAHGAVGEQQTAALLDRLPAGWTVFHGRRLPGRRHDLDHVLVSPCGTAVVVLDSKRWHFKRETKLVDGRVFCGEEDRHGQVEAVAGYAAAVQEVLGVPGLAVWPLLVVHGSAVRGGFLAAEVAGHSGPVWVLGPQKLVPTLAGAPGGRDPRRAAALTQLVAGRLPSAVSGA